MRQDVRTLAAAGAAGLLAGFFVNAVGGRLAMMLLARLNPVATGVVSDDGFVIGRFDVGATMNLVLFATALGVLGALVYLAVRPLRFGPPWFQTLALTLGPGVVIGAALVHTEGVDFRILQPAWLGIALFVALPALFAFVVMRLIDAWTRPDSWFATGGSWRLLPLTSLALVIPALPVVAPGFLARVLYKTVPALHSDRATRAFVLIGRLGVAAVFVLALVDLTRDALILL